MPTYLENLTIRLATGVAELPEPVRQRHVQYLLSAQQTDGGFAGREGDSDLYYTGFALR
ncbi:MAG: geranyl transferase, partial [Planctomycetales bacterium]|nr:geranyl transferase [Planctomycetales bacterium]